MPSSLLGRSRHPPRRSPPERLGERLVKAITTAGGEARVANAAHGRVIEAGGQLVDAAIQAGEALLAAKAKIDHGKWGAWLESNFDGGVRTARGYMKLAENKEILDSKRQRAAVLTIREAMRLLAEADADVVDESAADLVAKPADDRIFNTPSRIVLIAQNLIESGGLTRERAIEIILNGETANR